MILAANDSIIFYLFFAGMLAVVTIGFYLHYRAKKKLMEYAQSNGYMFSTGDYFNVFGRCRGFRMFNIGRSRRVYNTVSGKYKGMDFSFFNYRYTTGSGKNRSTHHRQGLLFEANICFPSKISMRPEGIFDKLAEVVGFDDIDFEYNEFNKKYYVKADDKRLAYDFFGRNMMNYLLMLPRPINLEVLGPHFLVSYNHRVPLQFYDRLLDTMAGLMTKFDKLTREKYGFSDDAKKWSETFYKDDSNINQKAQLFFGGGSTSFFGR